ncbi:unnamed protein product [Closterium sp. NIES-54]
MRPSRAEKCSQGARYVGTAVGERRLAVVPLVLVNMASGAWESEKWCGVGACLGEHGHGPPIVLLVPARSALALSGPACTLSRCPAATRTACSPCTSRPAAARASRSAAPRLTPCCSLDVAPCCPVRRALLKPARCALLQPARRAMLPCASRPTAARASRPAALGPATTTAAAARATAAAHGDAAGAGGAGGATGSAGGAAGARGAGPTTDRHCLSWPLSRQLQRLGVDSGGHCLSRTTPPLSSFMSGELFPQRCVTGSVEAAGLGASESAAALGASEPAVALGASESAVALGARASLATGPSSSEALHTFTLVCTTLTPLAAPGGPVVAQASTVLPCPAVPSGSLSSLHLPTFLTNLVSNAAIQDVWVDTFIHGGQRVVIYTLPNSLPSLLRSPAPPCLPCVEGRQRAAPHSSAFPPTTAPLQALHMDVWGPTPVGGTDQERKFLLVVDDYTRYTTVFPLRRKADVNGVLIPCIRATRHQLCERFSQDFSVLRLHSDRGGEFSSGLLAEFTLPASPQQNGTAERRIGLIMELNLWPRGALSLVRDAKVNKLSFCTLCCVFLDFPTDAPPWQFYHPRSHPLPPHGLAPLGVSLVEPPTLVEPLEISSDSSSPAEGGDSVADNTAATRRSPRLETPPGFPPRPSSPPPQPAAVDSGAETAGDEPGSAETKGEDSGGAATGGAATRGAGSGSAATRGAGSWGAATGGADSGGPASPSGGGAVGDPAGDPGAGQPPQPDQLETLSPQVILAWIIRRGSPCGGGYGPAGAGAASPGGTAGAGGTGGTAGGAGGTRGAAGAGGAGATNPRGATGAGGARPTNPGGTTGAGGAAGAGGARAGGTGGAGAAGPGGACTRGAGAATGANGTGGARGTNGARGPCVARAKGAAGAGGAAEAAGARRAGAAGTALRIPFFYP